MAVIAGGILLALFIIFVLGAFVAVIENNAETFKELGEAFGYIAFSLIGLGIYHYFGIL